MILSFSLIDWMDGFSIFIYPFIGWMGFPFSFIHSLDGWFFHFHSSIHWMDALSFSFIHSWDGWFCHFDWLIGWMAFFHFHSSTDCMDAFYFHSFIGWMDFSFSFNHSLIDWIDGFYQIHSYLDVWFWHFSLMDGWMDGWMVLWNFIHPFVGWMDCHFSFILQRQSEKAPASEPRDPSFSCALARLLAGWLAGWPARSLARSRGCYLCTCTIAALSLLSSHTKQTHLCIPENRLAFPPLALSGGIPVLLFHSVLCHTRLCCPFGVFCICVWWLGCCFFGLWVWVCGRYISIWFGAFCCYCCCCYCFGGSGYLVGCGDFFPCG